MNRQILTTCLLLLNFLALIANTKVIIDPWPDKKKPNIVIIFADDLVCVHCTSTHPKYEQLFLTVNRDDIGGICKGESDYRYNSSVVAIIARQISVVPLYYAALGRGCSPLERAVHSWDDCLNRISMIN